eukprot:6209519-Pleurochrysis_carterae.AAC.3
MACLHERACAFHVHRMLREIAQPHDELLCAKAVKHTPMGLLLGGVGPISTAELAPEGIGPALHTQSEALAASNGI